MMSIHLLWTACGVSPGAGNETQPPEAAGKGISFSNGNYDFLFVDESPEDACNADLSLIDYKGGKAIRLQPAGAGVPYVVIDAGSLLGAGVKDLHTMRITVEVENPGGTFYAVSGEILAYSGPDRIESADPWSVYLPNKNPNIAQAVLENETERFVPDAFNFFVLTRKTDNAVTAGEKPSDLILSDICFLDEAGNELPYDPDAGFSAPEGFGEMEVEG
jgi:hypothetical protein